MSESPGSSPAGPAGDDGRPRYVGRVGSLDAFWPLIEPVLLSLQPRRVCEIGVDRGIFTDRLLAWGREHACAYVGIDPAPEPAAAERVRRSGTGIEAAGPNRLIVAASLEALADLEPCEAYFIDGDHNYHTVRNELEQIGRAAARHAGDPGGPVIFAHDVGWPFARRDMYHRPDHIPPQARHPASEDLGVSLEGDELVADGLRSAGRYSIALHAGGPRNGVLTGIEDFVAAEAGAGWRLIILPAAYGLAILYRPEAVPARCRVQLEKLDAATATMGGFLASLEANLLGLYLHSEKVAAHLEYWTGPGGAGHGAHQQMVEAYQRLSEAYRQATETYGQTAEAYRSLDSAYKDLSGHSDALLQNYQQLLGAYAALDENFRRLREERDALRSRLEA